MASNNNQQISTPTDSSPVSSDLSQSSSLQRITSLSEVTPSSSEQSSSSSSPEHSGGDPNLKPKDGAQASTTPDHHHATSLPEPSSPPSNHQTDNPGQADTTLPNHVALPQDPPSKVSPTQEACGDNSLPIDMGYKTLAEIDAGGDPSLELLDICNTAAHLLRDSISHSLNHSNNDADDIEDCLNQKIEDLEKSIQGALTQAAEPFAAMKETIEDKQETEATNQPQKDADTPDASKPTKTAVLKTTPPPDSATTKCQNEETSSLANKEENKATESSKIQKKNQKNLLSAKKKREKSAEQVLRSLHGIGTAEEKLKVLCSRHTELAEELKETQAKQRALERSLQLVNREREQLQNENSRSLLARSRLESLCRELQRQNRDIKEESVARLREEEERRKELAAKFQTALQEMGTTVREQNGQLREENHELANRLKDLVAHYEAAEQHATRVVRQKEVEAQLHRAKFAKAGLELRQCQELHQHERQQLLATVAELQARTNTLAATEAQLRAELATYTDKYQDFQDVLAKSNTVFSNFKKDMDSMTKKIKKLEKETTVWKAKWEKSNATLMDMAADKQRRDQETVLAQNKITTLENLCRALQADRNALREQLDSLTSKPNLEAAEVQEEESGNTEVATSAES